MIGQRLPNHDIVAILRRQKAPRGDVLRRETDGRFDLRLDGRDVHCLRGITIADQAAGVDPSGCGKNIRLRSDLGQNGIGIIQGQHRQPA